MASLDFSVCTIFSLSLAELTELEWKRPNPREPLTGAPVPLALDFVQDGALDLKNSPKQGLVSLNRLMVQGMSEGN